MRRPLLSALFVFFCFVPSVEPQRPDQMNTNQTLLLTQERLHDLEMVASRHDEQIYINTEHIKDMDRRIETVDGQKLDNRLTILETEEKILLSFMAALVLDAAYRIIKRFNGTKKES